MSGANEGKASGDAQSGPLNPGDDAPPGTPGTGENVCPQCQGSGKLSGAECPNCGGTGIVIEGIAGG
ncbi:hypothetical protein D9599_06730 [Roseomonas sp. KE2513]|uniref:hypothetical protein n=1 Tax=Roseomonas sp. KE2513 TaxID=2479202 RepID=UPI0018E03694|nr:hypothetical protein [Roseomonas sp. KE2513]MBI0535261.1 hypothetical protein [Roseomonas sp. KE2513]